MVVASDTSLTAALVREARRRSRLSQRSFADLAATSGPAVAAYETGRKDLRVATLVRLARAADLDLGLVASSSSQGVRLRERRRRRRLALAAATAALVATDFERARETAEDNLVRIEGVVGETAARRWVDQWRHALAAGPDAVRAVLTDPSEHGDDMRQMGPFAGLLSGEARHAVLGAADVLWADDPG